MPPVKVRSPDTPPVARIVRANREPPVVYEPDVVRVRAVSRGFYAMLDVEKDIRDGKRKIVRNAQIRNVGEVFDMDTADMRRLPLGVAPKDALTKKEHPHVAEYGTTEIETEKGTFELPSWVVLADESGAEISVPAGHFGFKPRSPNGE